MKQVVFNEKNFGIWFCGVWSCSVECPYCEKYHSQSFIPNIEKEKSSYITKCNHCKSNVEIVADIIFINQLVDWWEYRNEKLEESAKRRNTKKWQVEITILKHLFGDEAISVDIQSNTEGMGASYLSKNDALNSVKEFLKSRNIKESDCSFYSDVTTKPEVFGGQTLMAFF